MSCHVQEMFGLELDPTMVYELDSSSSTKFSRHLVIHIPGMAFCSNIHAGCLVARALEIAASSGDSLPDLLVDHVSCPIMFSAPRHMGDNAK